MNTLQNLITFDQWSLLCFFEWYLNESHKEMFSEEHSSNATFGILQSSWVFCNWNLVAKRVMSEKKLLVSFFVGVNWKTSRFWRKQCLSKVLTLLNVWLCSFWYGNMCSYYAIHRANGSHVLQYIKILQMHH